jgi:EAL domain-containing protein (putative c-di-GMP-specific phosphodiesterase class I)/GGDEF domain-containing protein
MKGLKDFVERRASSASATAAPVQRFDDAAMIVSRAGEIVSVLKMPGQSNPPDERAGSTIQSQWPPAVAGPINDTIRGALRSRAVCQQTLTLEDGRSPYEIVCVPQGRDRALLLFRNLGRLYGLAAQAGTDGTEPALPTREYLLGELQRVTDAQSLREGRAALICINISNLDDAGHVFGPGQQEEILQQLGERLKKELRNTNDDDCTDLAQVSIVSRFDYRQFAVVLPSIDTGSDAESVTKRLVSEMQKPISVSGHKTRLTAQAGIALFPQDGKDAETLFKSAFMAMECTDLKKTGRYSFHSGTVSLRSLQRQDLEVGLKAALASDQFELNFLPAVDAHSRRVAAVEALLRWPDQILGSRPVRQLVATAERTGLILPIGQWVVKQACQQVLALRNSGDDQLRLAINVSAQEFSRPDYAERIGVLLNELEFDPAALDVEIQEHMLTRDAMRGYAGCDALNALGVGIVIDDFGTGACTLQHLAKSPVAGIKIDNTFVANLETNDRDRAACDAAIALARNLGLTTIAEGVETVGQATYLRDQGCDLLQGYFLMEPLADEALNEFMDLTATTKIRRVWPQE